MSENCFLCDFSLPSKKFFRKYTKNPPPHQILPPPLGAAKPRIRPAKPLCTRPKLLLGPLRPPVAPRLASGYPDGTPTLCHPPAARRSEVSAAVRSGGEAEAERRGSARPSALSPVLRRKPKCPCPFFSSPAPVASRLASGSLQRPSAKPRNRPAEPFCTRSELLLGHTRKTGAGPRPAPVLRSREWGSNPRPFRYE